VAGAKARLAELEVSYTKEKSRVYETLQLEIIGVIESLGQLR
jgi:hypothetical protein